MKRTSLNRLLVLLTLLVLAVTPWMMAPGSASGSEKLGKVHFPVSCSAPAQAQFDRAVALLHSFWFQESSKAFGAVTQADPSCAMGHWGIAMTWLGNPLAGPPSPKALQEGWAAVEKAKAAGAKTQRERDYIAAIEQFYKDSDKVDHRTRAVAYEKAMEGVFQRYPQDREAAVFYALALNVTLVPTDKTYANQLRAASVLEKVFAEQPEHPGVAHYLIHSYDFPPIANRGVNAARRYASIAPSAPHALHMPSHIFTRLGYWEESIDTNRVSAAVAKDELRHKHPVGAGSYNALHAMDYMMYGYLQMVRDREAKGVLEEIAAIRKLDVEHFAAAYAFAAIPARYALERGRWAEAAALSLHPGELAWNRFPQAEAVTVFARALGAARSGDVAAARKDLDRLQALRDALTQAKSAYWAEQTEIQRRIAAAWVARAEGQNGEALELMRSAADLEEATEKHPVTPGPIVPARELLGQLLMELGQPAPALREFEKSHRVEPNRFRGLYGAARAAELSGDRDKARSYFTKLVALAEKADTERPEIAEARAFLAKK